MFACSHQFVDEESEGERSTRGSLIGRAKTELNCNLLMFAGLVAGFHYLGLSTKE